jgi:hypothetical protein
MASVCTIHCVIDAIEQRSGGLEGSLRALPFGLPHSGEIQKLGGWITGSGTGGGLLPHLAANTSSTATGVRGMRMRGSERLRVVHGCTHAPICTRVSQDSLEMSSHRFS